MSRCVLVLGTPRCGSSAVAGALARLGVDMGQDLQRADVNNPRGYYEDLDWQRLNKRLVGQRYQVREVEWIDDATRRQYERLVEDASGRAEVWGVKGPRMCFTAQFIWPLIEDVRVVAVHRDLRDVAASLKRHSERSYGGLLRMTTGKARELAERWYRAFERRLDEFGGPVHNVQYEDLLDDPAVTLALLRVFVFDGLVDFDARTFVDEIWDAVSWIDPALRHNNVRANYPNA